MYMYTHMYIYIYIYVTPGFRKPLLRTIAYKLTEHCLGSVSVSSHSANMQHTYSWVIHMCIT